jgi:hypothetical protein
LHRLNLAWSLRKLFVAERASESNVNPWGACDAVAGNAERVVSGAGDRVYARGAFNEAAPAYGIFRQGKTYLDPETQEFLGVNADDIGSGEIVAVEGDVGTMMLTRSTQEVRLADRLFATIADMERDGRLAPTFGDTVRLLALTGARRSEIEGLRWDEVDLQRGVAMLPAHRSKTGRKTIPLGAPALAVLAQRKGVAGDSAFVFPGLKGGEGPANALSKNWQRVRKAAGLPGVRLHDLRHTLASFLVARGASLPVIGRVLGHTNAATTQRYAHLQADPLRAIVDDATARFATPARAPAGDNVVPLKSR